MTASPKSAPVSLRELQALVGGELVGPADATVTGIASLDLAGPGDLTFLAAGRGLKPIHTALSGPCWSLDACPTFRPHN